MPSITTLLALVASLTLTTAAPAPLSLEERQTLPAGANGAPYLSQAAISKGKVYFGTAVAIPGSETSDSEYMTILNDTNIFGQLTPGNAMKWDATEPKQNSFSFSGGQQVVNIAKATGKKVRCHNLVWHSQLPSWVSSGTWTNASLQAVMQNHITKVLQNYGSSCYSWDVVNEALNDDGSLESNIFTQVIGPQYVALAFKFASQAAKAAGLTPKLIYNDYGIENPGTKNTAAGNLVKSILAQGIQIDGVGFESHFIVGSTPSTASQMSAMQTFTKQGLIIHQTEIDVRHPSVPPTTAQLAQQARDYYSTVSACMQTTGCQGITVWDWQDKYSWVPSAFSGAGDACLYWSNYTRKAAYTAVNQAILGQTCTVC